MSAAASSAPSASYLGFASNLSFEIARLLRSFPSDQEGQDCKRRAISYFQGLSVLLASEIRIDGVRVDAQIGRDLLDKEVVQEIGEIVRILGT